MYLNLSTGSLFNATVLYSNIFRISSLGIKLRRVAHRTMSISCPTRYDTSGGCGAPLHFNVFGSRRQGSGIRGMHNFKLSSFFPKSNSQPTDSIRNTWRPRSTMVSTQTVGCNIEYRIRIKASGCAFSAELDIFALYFSHFSLPPSCSYHPVARAISQQQVLFLYINDND